jgi:hypothetical protein
LALLSVLAIKLHEYRQINDFKAFFHRATAQGLGDEDSLVARWANRWSACIVSQGINSEYLLYVKNFMKFISEQTYLEPRLIFRYQIENCPKDTFFYIRVHRNVSNAFDMIISDLDKIGDYGKLMLNNTLSFNGYGMGAFLGSEQKPRLYASLYCFCENEESNALWKLVVQEELFQLITGSIDIEGVLAPASIVEEAPPVDPMDELSVENRGLFLNHNVKNMCKKDVELLITLYSGSELTYNSRMKDYMNYIDLYYSEVKKNADRIMSMGRYKDLFIHRC